MVTDSFARGVPLLVKVAVKLTNWLTAGVELSTMRVIFVAFVPAPTVTAF
jgi:hypothetical protein